MYRKEKKQELSMLKQAAEPGPGGWTKSVAGGKILWEKFPVCLMKPCSSHKQLF